MRLVSGEKIFNLGRTMGQIEALAYPPPEKKFSAKFWLLLLAGAVAVGVAVRRLERNW